MLHLAGAPHADERLRNVVLVFMLQRERVTVEDHQCRGTTGVRRREQRTCGERTVERHQHRALTLEFVEHRGDGVGPLLERGQRIEREGI